VDHTRLRKAHATVTKILDPERLHEFQWRVPFKRYRVLAAEDDPQLREVLRDALTHDGFEACCVADGLVARERFESSGPFDALLLDDRMPLLTGRELLRELRAAGQNVPVLILSGHCDAHDEEWAALKPWAVLRKPIRMSEVSRVLREAIEGERSPALKTARR
jgi:DNA-binding response OmpR family regulator